MRSSLWHWLAKFGSAPSCFRLLGQLRPWLLAASIGLLALGLWGGLVQAPADYQQGDGFRIIYVHVPSAFLSLFAYSVMAFYAFLTLVWRVKIAAVLMVSCAPIGAMFTAFALITGMLWGKPMWGTYWVWDARLTSELLLLFIYLGVIGLGNAFDNRERADRAQALLALVGVVNLPIIHFSVNWWFTLHQGQTLGVFNSAIAPTMAKPLFIMLAAFAVSFFLLMAQGARNEILRREADKQWLKKQLGFDKTVQACV